MIEQKKPELKITNKTVPLFMPKTEDSLRKNLRIVFMGTPEFAVASLAALHEAGFNIVGVVTAPDKPGGRGMQLQQSAVKKYALENKLHVLQPTKLKDPNFYEALKALHADLQIVVAFRMLPEIIWNMPPRGTLNLHGSLLPQYRGAAPINWAVINGETETGVSIFKLKHEIDTGNILLQESFPLLPTQNAGEVHDHMKQVGAHLLIKAVDGLLAGTLQEKPQANFEQTSLKPAPKIFKENCQIDFSKTSEELYNFIRGLAPYPGAYGLLGGKYFKIFSAEINSHQLLPTPGSLLPGQTQTDGKTFLAFACADGYIFCKDVQLEGKKRMPITEFLKGWKPIEN